MPAQDVAVVRGMASQQEIAEFLATAFQHVAEVAGAQGLQITGPPFGRYRPNDDIHWEIEAGFPVSGTVEATDDVEPDTLPGGTVAQTTHVGAYDEVASAYQAVNAFAAERGYRPISDPWESYLDGPEVAEPRTELYLPCEPIQHHG
jgi:effector-binding domain-containing protein